MRMAARQAGSLVLIGSAAAFHALPFAAAYASSKAGLARFAEALRIALQPHGVKVTLVSPGFVDTAAARQVPGPKPGMLPPAVVAARIVAAGERGEPPSDHTAPVCLSALVRPRPARLFARSPASGDHAARALARPQGRI